MSTYNALSVPKYDELIYGIYDLKKEYGSEDRYWNSAVFLDSSDLRYPTHQTVQVLEDKWNNHILSQAQLMDYLGTPLFDHKYIGYSDIEIQKVKRKLIIKLKQVKIGFYRKKNFLTKKKCIF